MALENPVHESVEQFAVSAILAISYDDFLTAVIAQVNKHDFFYFLYHIPMLLKGNLIQGELR